MTTFTYAELEVAADVAHKLSLEAQRAKQADEELYWIDVCNRLRSIVLQPTQETRSTI